MNLNRRQFGKSLAAAIPALRMSGQMQELWGSTVVDCHHHLRRTPEANIAHMDGCGVSNAMVLARENSASDMQILRTKYPGRFLGWFASADITKPGAAELLTGAVKNGAIGIGELKSHVQAAGPELQGMYALAAELKVPILIHFQEVPHTPTEGTFSTGVKELEVMLKKYPKTIFIGHADAFWANISAGYANDVDYPSGKIKPGGVTDKMLGDYANLFGDLAANSGNNALARDPEFTAGFLKRHQDKLIFGSDCSCTDGKGGGISQGGNPGASRLSGKCVARETLTLLKNATPPAMFRRFTWENAHKVYQLSA